MLFMMQQHQEKECRKMHNQVWFQSPYGTVLPKNVQSNTPEGTPEADPGEG